MEMKKKKDYYLHITKGKKTVFQCCPKSWLRISDGENKLLFHVFIRIAIISFVVFFFFLFSFSLSMKTPNLKNKSTIPPYLHFL